MLCFGQRIYARVQKSNEIMYLSASGHIPGFIDLVNTGFIIMVNSYGVVPSLSSLSPNSAGDIGGYVQFTPTV